MDESKIDQIPENSYCRSVTSHPPSPLAIHFVSPPSSISFSCPQCQCTLRVPRHMAGVTGPCPSCGQMITSPREVTPPQEISYQRTVPPLSSLPAIPRTLPAGSPSAHPVSARPIPPLHEAKPRPAISSDLSTSAQPVAPTIIRPRKTEPYRPLSKKYAFLRILIPMCAVSILAVGYWQISTILQKHRDTPQRKAVATPGRLPSSTRTVATPPNRSTTPSITPPTTPSSRSTPVAETQVPTATTPDDQTPPPSGLLAGQIMEKFLAAPGLAERLPYLASSKTPDELSTTFLARPWPIAQLTPGAQIPHPAEGLIEYYYEVRFGENSFGFPRLATFLLHQHGNEPPKILVDPLLDTIGGRLQDFAANPVDGPQDFFVIMDARVKCFDHKIPNADKKCTFFLRSHIQGKDIVTAYANEQSAVRKEFDDPLGGLRWKNPIPVILTLQWNTQEDIARPFIEVIGIKAKSWNP